MEIGPEHNYAHQVKSNKTSPAKNLTTHQLSMTLSYLLREITKEDTDSHSDELYKQLVHDNVCVLE